MPGKQRVFVSYSSKNGRFVEAEVLTAIQTAKQEHWFAPRSIGVGDDWRGQLFQGLRECDRMLVVVSQAGVASKYVKLEVAHATRHLIKALGKVNAKHIHRAILPVKIDVRGNYGERLDGTGDTEASATPTPVASPEPYLLHPYLELINYVPFPHSTGLERLRDPKSGKLDVDTQQLTREQKRTMREYEEDRTLAHKRLVKALRNPEALRWGFKPLGRLLTMLVHPAVQRVAVASALLIALLALLPPMLSWTGFVSSKQAGTPSGPVDTPNGPSTTTGATTLAITANGEPVGADTEGIPFSADGGPIRLRVRAQTEGGQPTETTLTLRPTSRERRDDDDPPQPPGPTGDVSIAVEANGEAAEPESNGEITVPVSTEPVTLRVLAGWADGKPQEQLVNIVPSSEPPMIELEPRGKMELDETKRVPQILMKGRRAGLLIRGTSGGKELWTRNVLITTEEPTLVVEANGVAQPDDGKLIELAMTQQQLMLTIRSEAYGVPQERQILISPPPQQPVGPQPQVRIDFDVSQRVNQDAIPINLADGTTLLRLRAMSGGEEVATQYLNLKPKKPMSPEISFEGATIEDTQKGLRLMLEKALSLKVRAGVEGAEPSEKILHLVPPAERKLLVVRNYRRNRILIKGPGIQGRDIERWIPGGDSFAQLTHPGKRYELWSANGERFHRIEIPARLSDQDVHEETVGEPKRGAGTWIVRNGFDEAVHLAWRLPREEAPPEPFNTLKPGAFSEVQGRTDAALEFRPTERAARSKITVNAALLGPRGRLEVAPLRLAGPVDASAFRNRDFPRLVIRQPTLLSIHEKRGGVERAEGVMLEPVAMTALVVVNGRRSPIDIRPAGLKGPVGKIPPIAQAGPYVRLVPRGSSWEIYDPAKEQFTRHDAKGPELIVQRIPPVFR